jgi:serine/threonine-protein kinase
LERIVAVKVVLPALADDPDFARRFLTEARAMATLSDNAIVEVYDYGQSDGLTYLVMEYVEGESLREVLARAGALPAEQAMAIVARTATALHLAHGRGIVHRDIKPGNLLIRPGNQVVLTDFGIARLADSARLTMSGSLMGSAAYLAPEQVIGSEISFATDIYALGIVAYECLTGRRPFMADTPLATAEMHVETPPPPLPEAIAPAVREVVMRALAKDPGDRWPSAHAMAAAAIEAGEALDPYTSASVTLATHTGRSPRLSPQAGLTRPARLVATGVIVALAGVGAMVAIHGASGGQSAVDRPSTVGSTGPPPTFGSDPATVGASGPAGAPRTGGVPGAVGGAMAGAGAPAVEGGLPAPPGSAASASPSSSSPTQGGDPGPSASPTETPSKSPSPGGFVVVPDLSGLSQASAVDELKGMGLPADVLTTGTSGPCAVVAQDPAAGTSVHKGTKVTVTIGCG